MHFQLIHGNIIYLGTGGTPPTAVGTFLNNIANGLWYWVGSGNQLLDMISEIADRGLDGNILSVFTIPSVAIARL